MAKSIRIVADHPGGQVSITDAETGAVIHRVSHISIDMAPGQPVTAVVTVLATVDIVAEAEFDVIDITAHDEARRGDS